MGHRDRTLRHGGFQVMLPVLGAALVIAGRALAIDFPEIEPNDTKPSANFFGPITLGPGDSVSGRSTGTTINTGGAGSADCFRIRTVARPLGIYRHELAFATSGPAGHNASIRGIGQSNNVIGFSDVTVQVGNAVATPPRTVAWYGFGKQEEIYYRVTGTPSTTGTYTATMSDAAVMPVQLGDVMYAGPIRFQTTLIGGSSFNTELWLYDAEFNAITDAGADNVRSGAAGTVNGVPVNCGFVHTLVPGRYTLAVGEANLANHLASPIGDFGGGSVLDLPGAICSSVVNRAAASTVGIAVSDAFGTPAAVESLTFTTGVPGEIQFVSFTVEEYPEPSGVCIAEPASIGQGGRVLLSVIVTPSPGTSLDQITSVAADVSTITGNPSDVAVPLERSGQTAYWQASVVAGGDMGDRYWTFDLTDSLGGSASGAGCLVHIGPGNDLCEAATPLVLGQPATGDNGPAAFAVQGPLTACGPRGCRDVWFTFTPAIDGDYEINTCGTDRDTALAVFTTTDCVAFTEIGCDDDSGTPGPGCVPNGSASRINRVALRAGVRYHIRVSDFSIQSPGGPYSVIVLPVTPTGACCLGTCCNMTSEADCLGRWLSGTTCAPHPCSAPDNDRCEAAAPVELNSLITVNTCGATSDGDGPPAIGGACDASYNSIWYTFTPLQTGEYVVDLCGSTFDTELAVFTTIDCTSFVQIACSDDALPTCSVGSSLGSRIDAVGLSAGQTYHLRCGSLSRVVTGAINLLVRPVTPRGACCHGFLCSVYSQAECEGSFGVYQGDAAPCEPINPCLPLTGACCCGVTCAPSNPASCRGVNQSFRGDGSVCNAPGDATTPCCLADFNQNGAVGVQDIFDFLAAYFAAANCTDINGSGPVPTVQDIFDYLSAYFLACP